MHPPRRSFWPSRATHRRGVLSPRRMRDPLKNLRSCASRGDRLTHHVARHEWDDAHLEAHAMFSPCPTDVPVCGDEHAGVVNDSHRPRRLFFGREETPVRAALSSSGVKAPCSASHSATAARPSRIKRARLAAAVIHAETLVCSAACSTHHPWRERHGPPMMASLRAGDRLVACERDTTVVSGASARWLPVPHDSGVALEVQHGSRSVVPAAVQGISGSFWSKVSCCRSNRELVHHVLFGAHVRRVCKRKCLTFGPLDRVARSRTWFPQAQ